MANDLMAALERSIDQAVADNRQRQVARSMGEDDLLANCLDLAAFLHWRTLHIRPARTGDGWRTAVSGSGKGFPDLVLVKHRILYRELKSETGALRPEQDAWRDTLVTAGADWAVWKPMDWLSGHIERELRA